MKTTKISNARTQEDNRAIPLHVLPFVGLLYGYRYAISPVLQLAGIRCRHDPSCSRYAIDAFCKHGVWRGVWLTASRLSRCHPWGSYGFDPVPQASVKAGWRVWRLGDWAWTARGDGLPSDKCHQKEDQ